jgi:hypothetical protein
VHTAEKIIAEIDRLPPGERKKVLRHLERSQNRRSSARLSSIDLPKPGPYAALLALAGTGSSESSDVARDKYRHLAAAYAAESPRK